MKKFLFIFTLSVFGAFTGVAQAIYSGQPNVTINGNHNVTIPCGNGGGCYRASASQTLTGFSTTYSVDTIPYIAFPTGGATAIAIQSDDLWSPEIQIPFNFCFFGNNYNSLLIGSNGILTFDITQAGLGCPWALNNAGTTQNPIPNANLPMNSIMGPYQDIDPLLGGSISYTTLGTAPRRVFVVTFNQVPQYDTSRCPGLFSSSQIALYEGTNIIDVQQSGKALCTAWNLGNAIEGIQNINATVAYAVPGRNNTTWSATNDGRRFTPTNSRPTETLIKWHQLGSNVILSTTDTADLCPPGSDTTRFIVDVSYIQCDTSRHIVVSDTISVAVLQSAGSDQYLSCPSVVDSVRMSGSGSGGTWIALPGNPGVVTIDNPASPTTTIHGFVTLGTYYFVWAGGTCTDTARVIVSSRPNAGPDISNCPRSRATMQAVGTGTWTEVPGNPSPVTINSPNNPNTTIDGFSAGGTYLFVWNFATCSDTARVIVPVFSITSSRDTSLCKYLSTTLSVTASPANQGPFTYSWSDSTLVQSPHSATTAITPLLNTTDYAIKVTSNNGCVLIDTVTITLAGAAPRITITPSNNNVCPGDTIYLNTTVVVENLVSCGLVDTCPDNSLLTTASVGTGVGTISLESPYTGGYARSKTQYLFTAAELSAAGVTSGAITDISFFVNSLNSTAPYDSFTISMGCTPLTTLSGGFLNTLMEVSPPSQVFPNVGWSPHPFTHFYNWDGVSSLVIQVCYTNSSTTNTDGVAYTATAGAGTVAYARSFSTTGSNGCSLGFPSFSNNRPNVRFGNCAPNVLKYQWSPATLYCDTCNYTQVAVTSDSTYRLVVDDNGCINDTVVHVTINPYLAINATPADTSLCNHDTVRLNVVMLNQPSSVCLPNYTVTSIPYNALTGTATAIPTSAFVDDIGFPSTDDGTAGPYNIPFPFPFYCQSFTQFWANANAWVSFTDPNPNTPFGAFYNAQSFPPSNADNDPMNEIALVVGDYVVTSNTTVTYFTTGTAPNRIFVIKYNALQSLSSSAQTTSGQIQLHETSGIIDIMIGSSNYAGTVHTTGIKQGTGVGLAAPGRNLTQYTITTSEGWRFTPTNGASAVINSTVWSPNSYLSNDTIINPMAYPPSTQQYVANVDILINRFSTPEVCHVRDTVLVRAGSFPHTVTATPSVTCAGSNSQLSFNTPNAVSTYSWTPTIPLTSATISNPIATVYDTTTFYVIAMDTNHCHVLDSITVFTYPTPHPSLGADRIVCYTESVVISLPGTYSSYEWFNPGNPVPVATTPTVTAYPSSAYVLRLLDSATSCYYYTDTIHIDSFPHPLLHVSASGSLGFCVGGNVTLQTDQGYSNYNWSPSGGSGQAIPVTSAGDYSYTATDGNNCIRYSDTAHVFVAAKPVITLSPLSTICAGNPISVIATTTPAGVPVYWELNGTTVATGDTFTTTTPGTYEVVATQGCPDSTSVVLTTAQPPVVTMDTAVRECSCNPSIQLAPTVTPPTGNTFAWSNGTTGSTYTVDSVVDQLYTVTVTDANGCTATAGEKVTVTCFQVHAYANPDSVFAGGAILLADSPAHIGTNYGYQWYPSDSLGSPYQSITKGVASGVQPIDTFYLAAIDSTTGCRDTSSVMIYIVTHGGYRMPTAFTPNGDGKNETMYPVLAAGSQVTVFRVYNRWGQLVYDNAAPPGWNGIFGGNAQATDTYTYFVTIESPDPADAARKIQKSIEGTFQLFR